MASAFTLVDAKESLTPSLMGDTGGRLAILKMHVEGLCVSVAEHSPRIQEVLGSAPSIP